MISFIMLVCERTQYLGAAFDSLRAQGVDLEVVVYDSSAISVAPIVEKAAAGLKFTYIHAPKEIPWPPFIGRAWNRAVASSTGEFVAFIDDDDVKDEKFSRLMLDALADPTVDVAICNGRAFDDTGMGEAIFGGAVVLDRHSLLTKPVFITTGQMLVRRRVFDTVQFDPELPVSEDYDFSIQLCAFKSTVRPEALTYHRVSASSLSLNHRDVITPTQAALRHLLTKHGAIRDACSRCSGPLEAPPGHVNGGWHWFIRNTGTAWEILCGKDERCAP